MTVNLKVTLNSYFVVVPCRREPSLSLSGLVPLPLLAFILRTPSTLIIFHPVSKMPWSVKHPHWYKAGFPNLVSSTDP